MNPLKKIPKDIRSLSLKILFIFVGGTIIAMGVFGTLFYTISSKGKHVSLLAQELKIGVEREQMVKVAKKIIAETVLERQKLDSYFVRSDGIVELLERIEGLGRKTGVDVLFDTVEVIGEESHYLHLRAITAGRFDDTYYFLSLLELLPLKLSFERITLRKDISERFSSETKGDSWTGVFTIDIFSYLEK